MDAFGVSVIENALSADVTIQMPDAVVRAAEKNHKRDSDIRREESHTAGNSRNSHAILIEVPAGSAIISRQHLAPLEMYADCMPEDVLERHGPGSRMRHLLGRMKFAGFHEGGPDPEKKKLNLEGGRTWHA